VPIGHELLAPNDVESILCPLGLARRDGTVELPVP
jgi:hypothetical protein